MYQEHLYSIFQQSVEAKMNAADAIFPAIIDASQAMVNCLLNDGKFLICGNGPSAALAQILSNNLINRHERERPSFPAITLGCDVTHVTATANAKSYNEVFAKEIKALGNSGDILLVLSTSGNPANLLQAVQAAHAKEMQVIALSGRNGGHISSLLEVNDKEIRVPLQSRARIHELHLLTIFCLCDLIDQQLFGPTDS